MLAGRNLRSLSLALGLSAGSMLSSGAAGAQAPLHVISPDGRNDVSVGIRDGYLWYAVDHGGKHVLMPSRLGFAFRGAPELFKGLRITDTARTTYDSTWTQPWGEVARVRDHHNELRVTVAETAAPNRTFSVVFRAFEDGVGFRYEVPDQPAIGNYEISDELTEFTFAEDAKAWWTPSTVPKPDRYEMLYSSSPVSVLDTVNTPLTLEFQNGPAVVIHEADLVDYPGMNLAGGPEQNRTLRAALAPWADGVKVRGHTPLTTPWRTIQIADRAIDLAPSVITLKLNPPSRIEDTSWIEPMKYDGIWWGMHIGTMTWGQGPKHGATTANTKQYIDFAAANGMKGVLVEGWNVGWDGDWMNNGAKFSFTQAYPDYDLPALAAYAKSKGVTLIAHNETAMGVENYERQLDSAFALYQRLGIRAIKGGYVTDKTFGGDSHTGQYMVRHFRKVVETAAKYHIAVDMHEPIKDTGERRTWPNFMSREASRGQEYNAWGGDGGNPPEHETILFFTRMIAGPMDFTPGIFDILIKRPTGKPRTPEESRPRTTIAKQLALYVVLYSPLQMAADLPENYAGQPAFQFIRDVAVDWDTTKVLDGKIGDYVVVARKTKGKDEWFVGAITDEQKRTLDVPLGFLPKGRRYVAEIYADGPTASWKDNPESVVISSKPVTSATRLKVVLASGGGQAIRIRPAR
ncbi:MAG TPA: glycoside hydrolase family 97 protein [Gemmatimonadaceae bacterium]|nr:glycoside hydrolase family 97 protein [Gemmatimonadaceae bacterium]